MANYDQAEGLRRMLEQPKLRIITFLSALPDEEKSSMLINLADSLARSGKKTLIIDAKSSPRSIGEWMDVHSSQSLMEVVSHQGNIESIIKKISSKLSITKLSGNLSQIKSLLKLGQIELAKVFDIVVSRSDFVIVDIELDANDTFIISSLEDSEIIIQVSTDPSTIKNAYSQIKRLNEKSVCKNVGIVISGATQKQAKLIFSNLSQTANRYLAVKLEFIGYVPNEVHLRKAIDLGRSVNEIFPLSNAAAAFTQMANQLISSSQSNAFFNAVPRLGAQIEF